MRQKIAMITLGVADTARAIGFYERGIGWKRSPTSTKNLIVFSL